MRSHNLPIWIAGLDYNPVYVSKALRQEFGISVDELRRGFRWQSRSPLGDYTPHPVDGPTLTTFRRFRAADGEEHEYVSYIRRLVVMDESVGYAVAMHRVDQDTRGCVAPRPTFRIPESQKRIAIRYAGVALDHVNSYIRALGPLLDINSADQLVHLDELHRMLGELGLLDLPIDLSQPSEDFWFRAEAHDDLVFSKLSEFQMIGQIRPIFFSKMASISPFPIRISDAEMEQWLQKQGMEVPLINNMSCGYLERIQEARIDVVLEHDPEEWARLLFHGIPCYLMARPWNRWIRTPLIVHSTDQFLANIGVEPNQTYCPYDPGLMSMSA